jgi:hypothetical protein
VEDPDELAVLEPTRSDSSPFTNPGVDDAAGGDTVDDSEVLAVLEPERRSDKSPLTSPEVVVADGVGTTSDEDDCSVVDKEVVSPV